MTEEQISQKILEYVGGVQNIQRVTHCVTRLRLVLKDDAMCEKEKIELLDGVKGVFSKGGQLQIVLGTGKVDKIYTHFIQLGGLEGDSAHVTEKTEHLPQQSKLQAFFKAFSDIFVALIPGIVGCAMILGMRALLLTEGFLGLSGSLADNYLWAKDLASFFNIIATGLNFLPVFVAYSATKRFGGNPVLGIILGLILVHPDLGNRFEYMQQTLKQVDNWHFFGIAVPQVAFQGGIFPAILTSFFMAKFEKFLTKKVPEILTFILVPTLTIIFGAFSLFLIFGPLGDIVAKGIGIVADTLYHKTGLFGAFVFAAGLQPLVITGTHHMIGSIEAQLISTTGFNYIQPLWAVSIMAQGGAAMGVFFLSAKHTKKREIALSSFIPTLVGVSEPAIFAVNLKNSAIPFVCGVIGAGFSGIYMKWFDVKALGFGLTGIPGVTIVNPPQMIHYIIGCSLAFILPIIFVIGYHRLTSNSGLEGDK